MNTAPKTFTHLSAAIGLTLAVSTAYAASTLQPYMSNFTPASGAPGTVITVTGSGFTGLTSAWLGQAHDAAVSVVSDTQAKITVPKDASSGQVALFNSAHASFSGSNFTVKAAAVAATATATAEQPYMSGFTPFTGPVGTVVTVTGSGFTGLSSAWLGQAHDAGLSVVSDTVVKITVPADATTGQIALFNAKHSSFAGTSFLVTKSTSNAPTPVSGTGTASGTSSTGSKGTTTAGTTTTGTTGTTSTGTAGTGTTSSGTTTGSTTGTGATGTTGTSTTSTASTGLKVSVSGDHFIDGTGKTVQLRGVNLSGLEFVAVQGWDPADPWGGQVGANGPNFAAMKTWNINTVRIPLNEASWLGYTCVDAAGESHDPDPGKNYQATVEQAVTAAAAAGMYVVLDLHLSAPKNFCPLAQNPMADADNSLAFWKSIATQFKGNANVLFELFNEPYLYWLATPGTEWQTEMQGGSITQYVTGGTPYQAAYTWKVASMQDMLNTVRATGATNPVLISGIAWAGDLSQWLANKPKDPLNQLGAVWHAYPAFGTTFGTAAYTLPGGGQASYANAQSILSAGIPVFITESGDQNSPGTPDAPFESKLLPWADQAGASYLGWAWDIWQDASNVLIKDANGTPTDGYGVYFKAHLICVATSSNCK